MSENYFDNDATLRYKTGVERRVPVRFVTASTEEIELAQDLIASLLANRVTPSDVRARVMAACPDTKPDDLVYLYYRSIGEDTSSGAVDSINKFYHDAIDSSIYRRFDNSSNLKEEYARWMATIYQPALDDDTRILDNILAIQDVLGSLDTIQGSVAFSPFIPTTRTTSYYPTLQGERLTARDGLELFDNCVPSADVPFIRYNDDTSQTYCRLYTGQHIEDTPPFDKVVVPEEEAVDRNTLYLTIWIRTDRGRHRALRTVYYLDEGLLNIQTEISEEAAEYAIGSGGTIDYDPIEAIERALPGLEFGQGVDTRITGTFNIWGAQIDEVSFLHMVLNDLVMRVFLYVKENSTAAAFKKRLSLHYRPMYSDETEGTRPVRESYIANSSEVSFNVRTRLILPTQVDEIAAVRKAGLTDADIGKTYLSVKVTSDTGDEPRVFLHILRLLLLYYLEYPDPRDPTSTISDSIATLYETCLPDVARIAGVVTTDAINTRTKEHGKLKTLRERGGNVVGHNYSRDCQAHLQPILISADQVEEWKNALVPNDRRAGDFTLRQRNVMNYPVGSGLYFVCPQDDIPEPTLISSKRKEDPPQPCCGSTITINDPNSPYQRYLRGESLVQRVGAQSSSTGTHKIMAPDVVAPLPRGVATVLNNYRPGADMRRVGTPLSINSLLHCACIATQTPDYANAVDKEEYVMAIRTALPTLIMPALLRQELFDYTDAEIISSLTDTALFLDPSLFYRAIEEVFNINIYAFSPTAPSGDEREVGTMVLPRFNMFHSRPRRLNRRTIIVLRNIGSESNSLDYPQCELIVDLINPREYLTIFGADMTNTCHDILTETFQTYTVTGTTNKIYPYPKLLQSKQFTVRARRLDTNGDTVAFDVTANARQGVTPGAVTPGAVTPGAVTPGAVTPGAVTPGAVAFTLAVAPSVQDDPPTTTDAFPLATTSDVAISLLGVQPTAMSMDRGRVSGLWFNLFDTGYGEYVRVTDAPAFDLPLRSDPLASYVPLDRSLEVRLNEYSIVNYPRLIGMPLISQNIDSKGKARAFTVRYGSRQLVTIGVAPCQPENLPTSNEVHRLPIDQVMQFAPPSIGLPQSVSESDAGMIDGAWYNIFDIKEAIYIPLFNTAHRKRKPVNEISASLSELEKLPRSSRDPISVGVQSVTDRLSLLRHHLNIIRGLIFWTYEVVRMNSGDDVTPDDFMDQYTAADTSPDSLEYYNFDDLTYKIPEVDDVEEALDYLQQATPTLCRDGIIYFYNELFRAKMRDELWGYYELHYDDPELILPIVIPNFYSTEDDFKYINNTRVFLGQAKLSLFLSSYDRTTRNYAQHYTIRTRIPVTNLEALSKNPEPYLYRDEQSKLYLIQNVFDGSKERALAVALYWYQYGINPGSDVPTTPDEERVYVEYGVTAASQLEIVTDYSRNNNSYLRILYYGTPADHTGGAERRYGAMLEIL
jgi:hypothetical protein